MTSLKRLGGIFLTVFAVALGIQYAPDGVKTALGAALLVVLAVWFFGYVDVRELLNPKKEEKKL
jgi:hypothetical protein